MAFVLLKILTSPSFLSSTHSKLKPMKDEGRDLEGRNLVLRESKMKK